MPQVFYKGGSDVYLYQNDKTKRVVLFQRADDADLPYAVVSNDDALAMLAEHPDLLVGELSQVAPEMITTIPARPKRKKAED